MAKATYGTTKTKPWKHQFDAYNFLMKRQTGALFMGMGTGKSKVAVDVIVNKGFARTIVVCPRAVGKAWIKQFKLHAGVPILVKNVIGQEPIPKLLALKRQLNLHKNSVLIINYDSIWREPVKSFLLKHPPDAVFCDESHRIKSAGSKVSMFMHLLGKKVQNKYMLTGTPLAETPLDIYGQFRFMDSSVFGTNFDEFQFQYAWVTNRFGYNEILKDSKGKRRYKNLEELHDKMYEHAFRVTEDVLDLPPYTFNEIEFTLCHEAQKHYAKMKKEGLVRLKQGVLTTKVAVEVIMRLQQITCGYLPVVDVDGNTKVIEIDAGRRNTLIDFLQDLDPDEPLVVFAKYKKDLENIRLATESVGRSYGELSGRHDDLEAWQKGKTVILGVQVQSGSEGIDLTRARICMCYSYSHSLKEWQQLLRRVRRPGQTRPVSYYMIIANRGKLKTIDRGIMDSLQDKKDIVDYILDELHEE